MPPTPRTNPALVQAMLGNDYGQLLDGTFPDLNQYIAAATLVVNQVVTLAANKAVMGGVIDSDTQEMIERLLACHMYAMMDKPFAQKSEAGASGSFQAQKGSTGLETTDYGKRALLMDWTGTLEALDKRKVAGAFWLGSSPPTCQRNWQ